MSARPRAPIVASGAPFFKKWILRGLKTPSVNALALVAVQWIAKVST
jgi:hypothetical protein